MKWEERGVAHRSYTCKWYQPTKKQYRGKREQCTHTLRVGRELSESSEQSSEGIMSDGKRNVVGTTTAHEKITSKRVISFQT